MRLLVQVEIAIGDMPITSTSLAAMVNRMWAKPDELPRIITGRDNSEAILTNIEIMVKP
jgi:hypothetical protein